MTDTTAANNEDEDHFIVSGPFSIPINTAKHYEWSQETGWRVVANGER